MLGPDLRDCLRSVGASRGFEDRGFSPRRLIDGDVPPRFGFLPLVRMIRAKFRVRFAKTGDLRLVSHHDMMRCFERMMRRGGLPMRMTEGFNPRPKMVFAQALALGIVGLDEICDLELAEEVPVAQVEQALREQAPPGLVIHAVSKVAQTDKLRVRRLGYRLALPHPVPAEIGDRITALLESSSCMVERKHPVPRQVDVRPFVEEIKLHGDTLELWFAVSPDGTARPDDLVRLLGLGDVLDQGGILERIKVELTDEGNLVPRATDLCTEDVEPLEMVPTPMLQGPLSFDS